MNKNIFSNMKTHLFTKTKVYEKGRTHYSADFNIDIIPAYKIILSRYYHMHILKMAKQDKKPLSINSMKMKYGLPNNLDNYFITNPDSKYATKPSTINYKNAYKLILLLEMDMDSANLFLESLSLPRLNSQVSTNLAKAIHYSVRCSYSLEKTNEFLVDNKLEPLY